MTANRDVARSTAVTITVSRPDHFAPPKARASIAAPRVALYALGRIAWVDAQAAVPDGLLGILFVVAFLKTRDV